MVSASLTILCDLRPLMSAINPTPQESFSSAGSNRPKPDASIVVLARPSLRSTVCGEGREARKGRATYILEATFVPLAGSWLLVFAAVRRALAHRRLTSARLLPRVAGHQLGQQCCPMPNMANSGRQYKGN